MKIPAYKPIAKKEGVFNISPSSLHSFMDNSKRWYTQQVLRKDMFQGSTNSVLGSILHAVAEAYYKGEDVTYEDVNEYLEQYNGNQDVNVWEIADGFELTKSKFIEFLESRPKPDKMEEQIVLQPFEHYSFGGSFDAMYLTVVLDSGTIQDNLKLKEILDERGIVY